MLFAGLPSRENSPARIICEIAILLPLCLIIYATDLNGSDLWASHEARAAMDAQSLLESQDYLLPQLFDGSLELQKPPGYYWLVAGLATLRGHDVDEIDVRLPAALSATFTVLLVHVFVRRLLPRRPAFGIAIILMTSIHWIALARTGRIDMVLTGVVTMALILGTWSPVSRVGMFAKSLLLLFSLASALFLKGLIGWLMILGAWSVLCIAKSRRWNSRFDLLCSPTLVATVLLGFGSLILVIPWFYLANRHTNGELFESLIVYHHFHRAFGGSELASHPVWFYIPRLAFDFLPWSPFLLVSVVAVLRRRELRINLQEQPGLGGLYWFSLVAFCVIFFGLSFSRFKRADYLLPAYPWLAIFTGVLWNAMQSRHSSSVQRMTQILFLLVSLGTTIGVRISQQRDALPYEIHAFSVAVRQEQPKPSPILLFRLEAHQLSWQLGKPLKTVIEWHDLRTLLGDNANFLIREEALAECQEELKEFRLKILLRSVDFLQSAGKAHRAYVFLKAEKSNAP